MIRRSFLKIFLIFMFCTVFCATAIADDFSIVVNAPKSGWIVREIPAKTKTGVSYCSMRSSYNSGHVLVFARDAKGSNTIAIDFKQTALEVGQQYVVFFTVGKVERQLTAVAATNSVLTMRLGRDSALYNALKVNRIATFKIGSSDVDFNLFTGMSLGLKTLTKCVANIKAKKPFKTKSVSVGSDLKEGQKIVEEKKLKKKIVKKVKKSKKVKVTKKKKRKKIVAKKKKKPLRKRKSKVTASRDRIVDKEVRGHQSIIDAIRAHRMNNSKKLMLMNDGGARGKSPRSILKNKRIFSNTFSDRKKKKSTRFRRGMDIEMASDDPSYSFSDGGNLLKDISDMRMTDRERTLNRQQIENNKSKISRLIEQNRTLSMENKMVRTKSKEWAVESQRDKNSVREEILALKQDNMQLAMELQNDKDILSEELDLMRRRNDILAEESDKKILEARRIAISANLKQQEIADETELMRERNRRIELETKLEREEARRRSLENKVQQRKMDKEVSRIRMQNEKLLNRIAELKRSESDRDYSKSLESEVYDDMKKDGTYELKALLYNSGAVGDGYLDVELDPISQDRYYKWSDNKIYGFAREILNNEDNDIESVGEEYMNHLEGQCEGDFAKTIGNVKVSAGIEFLETEMACLGTDSEVAAAVLFLNEGEKLIIISQEGDPDLMEFILDKRKMLISTLFE